MEILEDVVLRETAALEAIQVEVFLGLQEEKCAAAIESQKAIAILSASPLSLEMRQKLIVMQDHFNDLWARNIQALDRMNRCVNRLAEKICEVARATMIEESGKGYDTQGQRDEMRFVSTSQGEIA